MATKITEEQKNKAIENYKANGNLSIAATAVGVHRCTLTREMNRSSQFKTNMKESKDTWIEALEAKLHDALNNSAKSIDRSWALLMMFTLKAHDHKYRDKVDHKVEGDIKIITGVPRPLAKTGV